jgi:hypothetical protein
MSQDEDVSLHDVRWLVSHPIIIGSSLALRQRSGFAQGLTPVDFIGLIGTIRLG